MYVYLYFPIIATVMIAVEVGFSDLHSMGFYL